MLTYSELQIFYGRALCALGCRFEEMTTKRSKGRAISQDDVDDLELISVMLEVVNSYDPDYDFNCNTDAEILYIVQYTAVFLKICLDDLTEDVVELSLDGIDYMNVALGDNVNQVG